MANAIALAQAYLKDAVRLNEVAKLEMLTKDLEANQVQFVGANTVKLPKITFGANTLGTYSRATGFAAKDINLAWDTYVLTQDKGDSLKLDAMDDEEGLGSALVPYVNQYIRKIEVPEVDKYRLTALATGAGTKKLSETITASNAVSALIAGQSELRNNEFELEGTIAFMRASVYTLFQTDPVLQKHIRVDEFKQGEVTTKILYFNETKLIIVPDGRMPDANANFILVHPTAQLSVVKHNPAHFYAAGQVPGFDGAQVDMRLYHDCFVITERAKGIYLSTKAAA